MRQTKKTGFAKWFAAGALAVGLAVPAFANHPVFVDGFADRDGDGRTGMDEDNDGADMDGGRLIFGTVGGCLGTIQSQAGNIANNGTCVIRGNAVLLETVTIMGTTGNVTIRGDGTGVANIAAFQAPAATQDLADFNIMDPRGLQDDPGIIINTPANRTVLLKDLTVENWQSGIEIMGDSNVVIDGLTVAHNVDAGIRVRDNAKVLIINSLIEGTGARIGGGDFPSMGMIPSPGVGIVVVGSNADVTIRNTTVANSFGAATQGVNLGNAATGNADFNNLRSRDLNLN